MPEPKQAKPAARYREVCKACQFPRLALMGALNGQYLLQMYSRAPDPCQIEAFVGRAVPARYQDGLRVAARNRNLEPVSPVLGLQDGL